MRKEKAPMTGRKDCSAGTNNYTAPKNHQSGIVQQAKLWQWLRKYLQITTLQARNELGIMHPAGRIKELREQGADIATYWRVELDAIGKKHRQAVYVLLSWNGVRYK